MAINVWGSTVDKVCPSGILRGIVRCKDTGNNGHKVKGGNNDKKTKIWCVCVHDGDDSSSYSHVCA